VAGGKLSAPFSVIVRRRFSAQTFLHSVFARKSDRRVLCPVIFPITRQDPPSAKTGRALPLKEARALFPGTASKWRMIEWIRLFVPVQLECTTRQRARCLETAHVGANSDCSDREFVTQQLVIIIRAMLPLIKAFFGSWRDHPQTSMAILPLRMTLVKSEVCSRNVPAEVQRLLQIVHLSPFAIPRA